MLVPYHERARSHHAKVTHIPLIYKIVIEESRVSHSEVMITRRFPQVLAQYSDMSNLLRSTACFDSGDP